MRASRPSPLITRSSLALILTAYVALAAGYALVTPPWNNPDEPAHFNYVQELAEHGRLPVLTPGDWDAEALERLKATRFPPDASIEAIRYEGHQPPLYYLLAAPIHRLTDGWPTRSQVVALRVLSIALGAVVVAAAYLAAWQLVGGGVVPLLAAATVAAIPMHTAMSAAINNDGLANAVAATLVVVLLGGLRVGFDDRRSILLGLLLGAALLTKLTIYAYLPLALGVVWWTERRSAPGASAGPSAAWRRPALALTVAAAISGWWFVRNMAVYGWGDPLGMVRHDAIVVGQPRWLALDTVAADLFGRVLFRSFWGQFGWMGIVLDDRLYLIYLALTVLALVGLALVWRGLVAAQRPDPDVRWPRTTMVFLTLTPLLVFAQVAYYNLTFIQPQGRYLFPALVPTGVLLVLGWNGLVGSERARSDCHPERGASGVAIKLLWAALLGTAIAWALADALALLVLGRFWPLRFVLPLAALVAVVLGLTSRRLAAPAWLLAPLGAALFLLDAACLLHFVDPAFR